MTPGHAIEAMWFIMDLGKRLNRPELIEKAKDITLTMAEYGWDKEYGGIVYFMDRDKCPPQQLEWDQKLWWVHIETLISMLKGYQLTGDKIVWSGLSECMTIHGVISKILNIQSGLGI